MKTTTIQVNEDVKAKLEEMKSNKDSYNDVLLEVLGMKEPKSEFDGTEPKGYMAEIVVNDFVNNEVKTFEFIESLKLTSDEQSDLLSGYLNKQIMIDGVKVRMKVYSTLEFEIEAKTKQEISSTIKTIDSKLPIINTGAKISMWNCYQCPDNYFEPKEKKED